VDVCVYKRVYLCYVNVCVCVIMCVWREIERQREIERVHFVNGVRENIELKQHSTRTCAQRDKQRVIIKY